MGSGHSITVEDIQHVCEEKDAHKQKEKSKKIFDAMDVNHNGSLDKMEMMALVEAYWKTIPDGMKSVMGRIVKESDYKIKLDEDLIHDLDTNNDGMVTFEEWHKGITSGVLAANLAKNSI